MLIKQWQERFAEIYPNEGMSPDYIMVHLYTNCSSLGESVLKQSRQLNSDHYVIRTIAWINALASHFNISYGDALIRRFPRVCPYCLSGPCRCSTSEAARDPITKRLYSDQEKSQELEAKARAFLTDPNILTYNWFIENIDYIYPSNRILLHKGGQSYVVSKFLEEGGELHRAYSAYLRGNDGLGEIEIELADLTSWVVSCWDLNRSQRDFEAELLSRFHAGCPSCRRPHCECPSYSITSGVEDLIRSITNELRSLRAKVDDVPAEIEEALDIAEEINSDREFSKSKNLLSKLQVGVEGLEKAGKLSKAAKETVGNLKGIVDVFNSLAG